ncbi:hypothetical protein PLESTB_001379200 [Pleodorina starrii]|uniref:Uncharacterized protein n=1 Tax=Pleodorina starrii TaxID=330485 RepID=A0A9W6F6T8_9CHLO|nr:hypothetical protein PLESTM_000406000 [Pleodorina starrii]GLC58602.1 hypothetical protein PLESTB_001379200 [Pleodorina starrii]GLC67491.1 hypothetical protein PLESTF_000563200 [Pleodorina starrii]
MPRGNPSIWKKHGASYSELTGTLTSVERAQDIAPRRLPPVAPGALAEARATKPAGTLSLKPHKGVGSFVLQSNWSLGVPQCSSGGSGAAAAAAPTAAAAGCSAGGGADRSRAQGAGPGPSSSAAAAAATATPPAGSVSRWAAVSGAASGGPVTAGLPPRSYSTESRTNYTPPPTDFRRVRSAGPGASQMVPPNHPNDWRTTKQVDFRPELTAGAPPPPPPFRQAASGPLLPTDVPPDSQFTTQHRNHFTAGAGRSLRDSQALRPSGCRATQAAPYNIITGAVPYNNNAFEHWDGRDYRRHR